MRCSLLNTTSGSRRKQKIQAPYVNSSWSVNTVDTAFSNLAGFVCVLSDSIIISSGVSYIPFELVLLCILPGPAVLTTRSAADDLLASLKSPLSPPVRWGNCHGKSWSPQALGGGSVQGASRSRIISPLFSVARE
jgi:hypothetical protein